MSQLEELKRQRKELDEIIKKLENKEIICGRAKFDGKNVYVQSIKWGADKKYDGQWRTVIYSIYQDAKPQLESVINDLKELYDKM